MPSPGERESVPRSNSSRAFFGGMLLLVAFAIFTPGAPVEGTHLVVFGGGGLLLLLFPPRYRIPAWLLGLSLGLIVASALPLLPRNLAGPQPWREHLDSLGLDTGSRISPHPEQSLTYLCGLAASVIIALGLVGHRAPTRTLHAIATAFTGLVAVYALVSIMAQDNGWSLPWDPEPSFGFFPNRNHSATLMAMGSLCGLGVLFQAITTRKWITTALVGAALGILAWALLGYCGSRAGALLLVLGSFAWILGLGRRYLSPRSIVSAVVLGGLTLFLFFASDATVKERLEETFGTLSTPETEKATVGDDTPVGFRLVIYEDTASMIGSEPWTGVGLGLFQYVFPQYREASASNALCVHPESDWLMVAAESGIPATLILAALTLGVLILAFRRNRRRRSWPLRLGCLLAACVVPVHGILDVPGHRVGLAFAALLLVGMVFQRRQERPLGRMGLVLFRGAGALLFIGCAFVLLTSGFVIGESPLSDARTAAERMRALYAEDQAAMQAAGKAAGSDFQNAEAPVVADTPEPDKLELALLIGEAAIARTPLDPEIHHLRGAMALSFDDKDALAEQSFAIQRALDPVWVDLPLRQSTVWLNISSTQTLSLWQDALARAERLARTSPGLANEPDGVWNSILTQAGTDEALLALAFEIAGPEASTLTTWLRRATDTLRERHLPGLLVSGKLDDETALQILREWHRLGKAGDAENFARTHSKFETIAW